MKSPIGIIDPDLRILVQGPAGIGKTVAYIAGIIHKLKGDFTQAVVITDNTAEADRVSYNRNSPTTTNSLWIILVPLLRRTKPSLLVPVDFPAVWEDWASLQCAVLAVRRQGRRHPEEEVQQGESRRQEAPDYHRHCRPHSSGAQGKSLRW